MLAVLLLIAAVCLGMCSCAVVATKGAIVTVLTSTDGDAATPVKPSSDNSANIVAYRATNIIDFKKKNVTADGFFVALDKSNKTVLTYYGLMLSGAVARSASATAVHPLNVIKTMLQTKDGKVLPAHVLGSHASYTCLTHK